MSLSRVSCSASGIDGLRRGDPQSSKGFLPPHRMGDAKARAEARRGEVPRQLSRMKLLRPCQVLRARRWPEPCPWTVTRMARTSCRLGACGAGVALWVCVSP